MPCNRWLSRLSLAGGVLVILIGILHTAATPMVHRGLRQVLSDKALGVAYFFAVMGLYVIFSGWLMVYSSRGLGRGERWARTIAIVNGACNGLGGVGAAYAGFRHSLVWAWLGICVAVAVVAALCSKGVRPTSAG